MNIERITPENYKVPKGEERSYHCIIECKQYDPKTGKKISVPRIQKFGRKMFESHVYSSLKKQGYEVTILHNPVEWLKQQALIIKRKADEAAAKKAEEEKAAAEAKKAEEEKKFQEAVKAEVARQMAAMQGEKTKTPDPVDAEPKGDGEEKKEQSAPKNRGGRPKKQ